MVLPAPDGASYVEAGAALGSDAQYGAGVGFGTEIDSTVFGLDVSEPADTLGSVGFKTSLRVNGEQSTLPSRIVFGNLVLAGARTEKREQRTGNWCYVMWSTGILAVRTKLTGGVSHGTSVMFGERTVFAMAGIEQQVTPKWMFQADWMSGKHDLGYWIPGCVYKPWRRWMISFGYQFPNPGAPGYRAVVFELTRN